MLDVLDVLALWIAADGADVLALTRVVHVREARVVELEIGAPELPEPAYLLGVRSGQIRPELADVGIDRRVDRGRTAAVVDHARRRDRQLGDVRRDCLPEEPEIVAEDRLGDPELPADVQRCRCPLDVSVFIVERDRELPRALGDTVERVDEVHVPGSAPELAVRGEPEPDLLLHADDLANGSVLGLTKLGCVDRSGREVVPRTE